MATYASLGQEDKAVVDNFTNILRAACGECARLMNHLTALQNDSNAVTIFNTIDSTESVPNMSGLAGADSMLKSELVTIYQELIGGGTSLLTKNTTANRNLWTKAAGIANMIG